MWQVVRHVCRTTPLNSHVLLGVPQKKGVRFTPNPLILLVPGARLELARCCHRRILSPLRLPIPPSRQKKNPSFGNCVTVGYISQLLFHVKTSFASLWCHCWHHPGQSNTVHAPACHPSCWLLHLRLFYLCKSGP